MFARNPSRTRLDVGVTRGFPAAHPARLARVIRQDVWRACQRQRGFSPVIRIEETAEGLAVTAGAQIDGKFPRVHLEARIAAVLDDPANRARWMRSASKHDD